MKTVQRDAQQLQKALDEIHAMQMRIDSLVNYIRIAGHKDAVHKLDLKIVEADLLDLNDKLLKIVPVLTGHELPKRG